MNTCFQIIVHFLVIFLNNLFVFNWQIIALQYCVGFCHTSKWISHRYTYITFLLNLLPLHHTPLHSFAKSNRSCLQKKKNNQSFYLGKSAMKHICPYLTEVERPSRKIKVAHLIYESHFILITTHDMFCAKWNLHHQVNHKT